MSLVIWILMAVGAVLAILGWVKMNGGSPAGRPMAMAGAILVVLCAVARPFLKGSGQQGIADTETRFAEVAAQKLGKHLAQEYPGAKALLIHQVQSEITTPRIEAEIAGLKKGFGTDIELLATEAPSGVSGASGMPAAMVNMQLMSDPSIVDGIVDSHPECDLVVSAVPFPMDPSRLKLWRSKKTVAILGQSQGIGGFVRSKKVAAIVINNPQKNADPEQKVPDDLDEAFDMRYLLITPENFMNMMQQFSNQLPL
jgi:hypothetical protein